MHLCSHAYRWSLGYGQRGPCLDAQGFQDVCVLQECSCKDDLINSPFDPFGGTSKLDAAILWNKTNVIQSKQRFLYPEDCMFLRLRALIASHASSSHPTSRQSNMTSFSSSNAGPVMINCRGADALILSCSSRSAFACCDFCDVKQFPMAN